MKPVILALILLAEVAGATDPLCGDCDANSDVALPDVLAAAQEALGGYAGPLDRRGCDVDSDGAIDVLESGERLQDPGGRAERSAAGHAELPAMRPGQSSDGDDA